MDSPTDRHAAPPTANALALRLLTLLAVIALFVEPTRAQADAAHRGDDSAQAAVASALANKDYAAAYRALTSWHRTRRSPQVLYWLGKLAAEQGHVVESQDLMRRYLAEASDENQALSAEAHRVLAAPRPPSAEVTLLGPTGALVFVDEKLVGALPLSAPLILGAGMKDLAIELKQQRIADRVRIMARRTAEVRFELSSGLVVASQGPALLLLTDLAGSTPTTSQALQAGIEQGAIQRRWVALLPESLPLPLSQCAADLACLRNAANQQEVEHVVVLRSLPERGMVMTMIDTVVGAPIADKQIGCAGCAPVALTNAARDGVSPLIEEVISRGRGTLSITTTPAAAQVFLDERPIGTGPVQRPYFGGSYELRASLPGYKSTRQPLTLRNNETTTLDVQLQPGEDAKESPRKPQTRRIAGALGIGGSIFLISVGAALVAIDGSCAPVFSARCGSQYDTRGGGGAMIGIGLGLGITSGILFALPQR